MCGDIHVVLAFVLAHVLHLPVFECRVEHGVHVVPELTHWHNVQRHARECVLECATCETHVVRPPNIGMRVAARVRGVPRRVDVPGDERVDRALRELCVYVGYARVGADRDALDRARDSHTDIPLPRRIFKHGDVVPVGNELDTSPAV